MARTDFGKRLGMAAAVFACAFGYFALFRAYGFQLEDEGTLLFQLDRVTRGQYPYIDFHTGYTPGFFAVGAALLRAVDFDVASLRTALAVLNALTAAGLYLVAAPLVGTFLALASPLAFVLFLPVWPGDFAAFNVPYPAWPATAAWIASALAVESWMRRGGLAALAVAGAIAGIAFGIKPNAGAFALAASTWIVVMGAREGSALDRAAGIAASVVMLLGIWFAFGLTVFSTDAVVHLPACTALAVIAAGAGRGMFATPRHPRTVPALAALLAGFAIPTLAWAIPVLGRLGAEGFARDVLLIGSGAADLYYLPHPAPELWALAVAAAIIAIAGLGQGIRRGLVPPLPFFVLLAGGAAGGVLVLHQFSLAPEGFGRSLLWQLENAAFWLAPLANIGGVVLLARRIRSAPMDDTLRGLAILVPLSVAMYLQLYPRSDFMHLLMGVPLTFVLALFLLRRVASWWSPAAQWPRGRHAVGAFVGAAFAAVLAVRLGVNLEPLMESPGGDAPRQGLVSGRATLWAEDESSDDLVALGMTTSWLRAHVAEGEPVLAFPAAAGVLFLTATTSPVAHDYWYPGRPDHHDETAMLGIVRNAPPRYVVTLNGGWFFFTGSPAYFADTRAFVCERYQLAARFGRFDILARRDLAYATDEAVASITTWQPVGSIDDVPRAEIGERRQAVRRWLAGLKASDIAGARLPDDRVKALLLLRGLRDAGDLRSTAWLLAGYRSPDGRLHNEAVAAMDKVTDAFHAAQHRWACDADLASLRPFVAEFADEARKLREEGDPRVHAFAEAVLSVVEP